jgi:molybdenum cofactor guanylyltransferase
MVDKAGKKKAFGAFILVGGQSSRMGQAKALLPFAGMPLVIRVARLVEAVADTLILVGEPEKFGGLGFRVIADERANLGPLGAILTALRASKREWNLIVGCDLPFLTHEWLEFLIARAMDSPADVVIPLNDRGYEPLCAMYRQRAHASIEAALERGVRKVTDGLAGLTLTTIAPSEWKPFDPRGTLFKNINTPADYEEARADAEAEAG